MEKNLIIAYIQLGRMLGRRMNQLNELQNEIHSINDPVIKATKALLDDVLTDVIHTALQLDNVNLDAVSWIVMGAYNEEVNSG